jgi:small subunit ribosomal protein S10
VLDQSAQRIVGTAERTGAQVLARCRCLPASNASRSGVRTFIDKDSQEHFEIRTHKRLIDVLNPDSKTIEALLGYKVGMTQIIEEERKGGARDRRPGWSMLS